jgi:MFS superfamily sulfate permease-like transporter
MRSPPLSSRSSLDAQAEDGGDTLIYRIIGQLTYINSIAHVHRIKRLVKQEQFKNVIVSLQRSI